MNWPKKRRDCEEENLTVREEEECPNVRKRKRLRTVRDRNALRNICPTTNARPGPENDSVQEDYSTSEDERKNTEVINKWNKQNFRSSVIFIKELNDENAKTTNSANTSSELDTQSTQESISKETNSLKPFDLSPTTENEDFNLLQNSKKVADSEEILRKCPTNSERIHDCPLCQISGRKFSDVDTLIFHLSMIHNLDLNQSDLIKFKNMILYKENEISLKDKIHPQQRYSRPFSQSRCKMMKLLLQNQNVSLPPIDVETVESPKRISKARSDDHFTCLKCLFTCESEDIFYNHVKCTHVWSYEEIVRRMENGANLERAEFWCPECSSRFATKSTLSMHLKGTHEFVEDVNLYLEKIGYEGEIPLLENQCDICYELFKGHWDLERHVRCHGLAFLRRQQLLSKLRRN